jgi:hypothetical protein
MGGSGLSSCIPRRLHFSSQAMNALYPWDDSRAEEKLFSTSRLWREHPMTLRKKVLLQLRTLSRVRHGLCIGFGLGCLLALNIRGAGAEPVKLQSAETQTALLELFTSEGCSRCPAAELWLSRFKDSPRLWKEFVPVAFHVDYWDRADWKDPFGSKIFSKRQDAYAEAWHSDSLRTPDFVWNGTEWMGWYHNEELPAAPAKKTGLLVATSDDQKKWTVQFSPATGDRAKYVVHAALLGFGLGSKVKGVENSGADSTSDFVVLAFVEKSLANTANGCQGELELKRKKDLAPKRTAVAFWVTPAKAIHPVQALGGWLSPTND